MKICYFGIYDPEYARNRVLIAGLKEHGHEVYECRVDPKKHRGISKWLRLCQKWRQIRHVRFGMVIVAFPGQSVMPLARILFGRKIVFDAFVSLYDSNVHDRKLYGVWHPKAWRDFFLDWVSMRLAGTVLFDTHAHSAYAARAFRVAAGKFRRVFVGTDPAVFVPRRGLERGGFTVHFHGSFIPLQGISYILEAARLLSAEKDISFTIVGRGQEYARMRKYAEELALTNVSFVDPVPYRRLPELLNAAHVVLGIFGDTEKAGRVIPNKVYEALACGRPVLTARTRAAEELLSDGISVCFCRPADARDLADKILLLRRDPALREMLGRGARKLYEEKLTPFIITGELLKSLSYYT